MISMTMIVASLALMGQGCSLAEYRKWFTDEPVETKKPLTIDDVANFETFDYKEQNTATTAPTPSAPTTPKETASTTTQKGKYYAVPAGKTGKEICSAAGKSCVGYTSTSVDTCLMFHPGAMPTYGLDGSKSPYFCDGAPQSGICAKLSNSCNICTACNVNENCDTQIGQFAREAFVECS